jgi:nucleotide-binding universal stress UspA family protein
MSKRVLVPMDGSPQSDKALDHVLTEYPDAEITILHVIDPVDAGYAADPMGGDYWEGWYEFAEDRADNIFEAARDQAAANDREIETVQDMGPPARLIVGYAEENGIDHIVMGSHGRKGVARVLLGSVAETVVRRASMPVTVVR